MREINPRAWSIDGECWCTRVDYDGYKKEWSGIAPVLAPDNRSKRLGEIEDTNIIVELPTGLKDKNGKEIYEGDILQDESNDAAVVIWREYQAEWGIQWIHVGIEDSLSHRMEWGHLNEIIGNIHENPELLGGTNATNKEEE